MGWEFSIYFDQFRDAGLCWVQFTKYHFRLEGLVDFWMPDGRWYVQPHIGPDHPYKGIKGQSATTCVQMVRRIQEYLDGEIADKGST